MLLGGVPEPGHIPIGELLALEGDLVRPLGVELHRVVVGVDVGPRSSRVGEGAAGQHLARSAPFGVHVDQDGLRSFLRQLLAFQAYPVDGAPVRPGTGSKATARPRARMAVRMERFTPTKVATPCRSADAVHHAVLGPESSSNRKPMPTVTMPMVVYTSVYVARVNGLVQPAAGASPRLPR